jgi:hypothetical protein
MTYPTHELAGLCGQSKFMWNLCDKGTLHYGQSQIEVWPIWGP